MRPTEYNSEFTMNAKIYLASCVDKIEEFHKTRGESSDSFERHVRVKIPTIEGLALHLGIARSTVYDWKGKYSEFSDIVDDIMTTQAERLLQNGLSGDYNASISKVILTKHGYVEKHELTGEDGKDLFAPLDAEKAAAIAKTYQNANASIKSASTDA